MLTYHRYKGLPAIFWNAIKQINKSWIAILSIV